MCSETFQQARYLRRHLVLVHNKSLQNVCQICNESFSTVKNLRHHLQRAHGIGDQSEAVSSHDNRVSHLSDEDCDMIDNTSDSLSLTSEDSTAANGLVDMECIADNSLDEEEMAILKNSEFPKNGPSPVENGQINPEMPAVLVE